MSDYLNQIYESYKRQRTKLDDAALEAGARYDRTVLTLGGGAMALSLTFVEKIAPSPQAWTLALLILAWLALLVSVILQLLALASSQKAIHYQIQVLDVEYQYYLSSDDLENAAARKQESVTESRHVKNVRRFNEVSRWSLIVGIILLFLFSGFNIQTHKESTMTEDKKENTQKQGEVRNREHITGINESVRGTYIPPSSELPPPPPPKEKKGQSED